MRKRRQAGIALIVVTVTIAVLGAVVGDFSFNARVDLEAAANARDTLRAEYLARSGMQLSRLLIKVQQSVLDKNRQFIGDIQIADFAPLPDEGVRRRGGRARRHRARCSASTSSQMKGLGVGKGATFDVTMTSDDGRINLNCGGGLNPQPAAGAGALRHPGGAVLAAALREPALAHLGLARLRRADRAARRDRRAPSSTGPTSTSSSSRRR